MKTQLQIAVLTLEPYLPWVRNKVGNIDCDPAFLIALETAIRIVKEDTQTVIVPITAETLRDAIEPWFDGNQARTAKGMKSPKIEAIKSLRAATGLRDGLPVMTLGDAKWAVENWPAFIGFVKANGRLPEDGYLHGLR